MISQKKLAAFLVAICFLSCSKEDTEVPTIDASCKIKKVVSPLSETIFSFNSDGKLHQINDSERGRHTYTYFGNTIVVYVEENSGPKKITLTLNSQKQVISRNIEVSPTVFSNAQFEYNGTQLITYQNSYSDGFELFVEYTWNQGNLKSISMNGQLIREFEYYLDKPISEGDPYLFEQYFLYGEYPVVRSKNLIKSIIDHDLGVKIYNFEYTFDSDGRITTVTRVNEGEVVKSQYSYDCNKNST